MGLSRIAPQSAAPTDLWQKVPVPQGKHKRRGRRGCGGKGDFSSRRLKFKMQVRNPTEDIDSRQLDVPA